jgi:hypothetical protein
MKDTATASGRPLSSTRSTRETSLQPRVLYFAVFIFFSLSGGRFTATFLEHELNFTKNWMISSAMAVQILTSSACSSWLGGLADSIEARGIRNGRLQIMASGLLLSTVATLLHILGRFWMTSVSSVSSTITEDDNYTENDIESQQQVVPIPLLTYHLVLRALYAIGTTACSPVLDGLTLARLENDGRDTAEYGKERLYGAVSWGIANVFFGPAIDKFGFTIIYVTTTISFIGCITTFYFYVKSNQMQYYEGIDENDLECISENEESAYKKATAKYKSKTSFEQIENEEYEDSQQQQQLQLQHQKLSIPILLSVLTKKNAILNVSYIVAMFTLYIGMSVVENLIFLYFEFLGGSYSMCGITVAVTVLFELPLFHYAPEVLRRLKSPVWLFQFGCIAYVIRVVGYSLIPLHHPYWTLILEPLHGVTIGFVTVGCVEFAAEWVPKNHESSGQGFLSMIRGLGQFVGLCIGGFLEGRILYRILAAIVTVGSVILAIGNYITIIETPIPNAEEEDRISSTSEKKEQSNKHGLELMPLDDEPTILT